MGTWNTSIQLFVFSQYAPADPFFFVQNMKCIDTLSQESLPNRI